MPHAHRNPPAALDPHGAFVFSTRALGRQPGAVREETRTIPAPADLRVELAGVPEGAGVETSVRLEAVSEGVLVTGTAAAPVTGECARCLDPLATSVEAGFQELYAYEPGPGDEEDGLLVDGDLLDLEPVFRDAVVLALPLSPLCTEDCPGLCAQCGARLADAGPDHGHGEAAHPVWEALRGLDVSDSHDEAGRRGGAGDRQEG